MYIYNYAIWSLNTTLLLDILRVPLTQQLWVNITLVLQVSPLIVV